MKLEKETLIAIVLCLVMLFAWPALSKMFKKDSAAADPAETAAPAAVQKNVTAAAPAAAPAPVQAAVKKAELPAVPDKIIANGDLTLTVNPLRGGIVKSVCEKYNTSDLSRKITNVYPENIPGILQLTGKDWKNSGVISCKNIENGLEIVRLVTTSQGEINVKQLFTLDKSGYVIKCSYFVTNPGSKDIVLQDMTVHGGEVSPWHYISGDKIRAVSHRFDYLTQDDESVDIKGSDDDGDFFVSPAPTVKWAAVSNKYFCSIISGATPFILGQRRYYLTGKDGESFPIIAAGARLANFHLAPQSTMNFEFSVYDGPKTIANITAYRADAANVMHLAWGPLNYLARAMLWILNVFNSFCHSYGWSIIMLTILVRALFYPLTARSNESMKKMSKVQPILKELREKYKDNPQLLNQKMTEVYRTEGVNPFAGCLPILLQIPIFFALYAMLDNTIELRHESFYWCKNLAAADTIFTIPLFGWSLPVNPLVLAMTVLMVIQQRMTPMSMDPAQKKMMALMPIVMLIFLYDLPSGLTLYWTASNLFSIIQLWLQKSKAKRSQTPKAQA